MTNAPVILVSQSKGSNTHVGWFKSVWYAERNHVIIDVSVNGINVIGTYLNEIPDDWLASAREAYAKLAADPSADLSSMATHKHSVVANGPLVEVN